MSNASLDQNTVPTLIAASSADGTTIVKIKANASNHGLQIDDAHTGSDNGNNKGNAMKDENMRPVLLAVSSSTTTVNGVSYIQGVTPVEVYGDLATGKLLVDSN